MAEHAPVGCGGDRYRHDLILKIPGTRHRHSCKVRGGADAMGLSRTGFKEDRDGLPDLFLMKGESFGPIKGQKNVGAFLHG